MKGKSLGAFVVTEYRKINYIGFVKYVRRCHSHYLLRPIDNPRHQFRPYGSLLDKEELFRVRSKYVA